MSKNRLTLIAVVLLVLFVSLAISGPFSNAPKSADPEPVAIPVTDVHEPSDYHQRHSEKDGPVEITVDTSDYFTRHPALRLGLPTSTHTILDKSLIDDCVDVSVSELAACREASQSASQ